MPNVPLRSEKIIEEIEVEQYEVHKRFIKELSPYLEPKPTSAFAGHISQVLQGIGIPPKPRKKYSLCQLVGDYAANLLAVEYKLDPATLLHESSTIDRISSLVMDRVLFIGGLAQDVTYHASEEEMRSAAREHLLRSSAVHRQLLLAAHPHSKTPGDQIRLLRSEAKLTVHELSTLVHMSTRSIFRHESDDAQIRKNNKKVYERVFSELLERPISLENVTHRRKSRRKTS